MNFQKANEASAVTVHQAYSDMDARQFFELVRRMRAYQREYFKNRRKSDLQQSKILESKVDEEIKRVEAIVALPDAIQKQPSMFDYPNK